MKVVHSSVRSLSQRSLKIQFYRTIAMISINTVTKHTMQESKEMNLHRSYISANSVERH